MSDFSFAFCSRGSTPGNIIVAVGRKTWPTHAPVRPSNRRPDVDSNRDELLSQCGHQENQEPAKPWRRATRLMDVESMSNQYRQDWDGARQAEGQKVDRRSAGQVGVQQQRAGGVRRGQKPSGRGGQVAGIMPDQHGRWIHWTLPWIAIKTVGRQHGPEGEQVVERLRHGLVIA